MAKPKLALIPAAQGDKFYSVLPSDGVGDFTFTRASTGTRIAPTGLIEEVPSGDSRLDYDLLNGKVVNCPHYLLEPARTNLITYSEDFSNASWVKDFTSITSNVIISPDGGLNASLITADGLYLDHTIYQQPSLTPQTYTLSAFVKKNTQRYVHLAINRLNASTLWVSSVFDLDTLDKADYSNGSGYNDGVSKIENYGNDWYKISLTAYLPDSTVYLAFIGFAENMTAPNISRGRWQFATSNSFYVWGAQLEQGSYPTSYIPTNGTAITRAAETANGSGNAATFNDSEGVLMLEASALANDGTNRRITLSDGTIHNRILIGYTSSNNEIIAFLSSGGSSQFLSISSIPKSTDFNKISIKYKVNDFALWVNGFKLATDTSGNAPIGLNTLQFKDANLTLDFYGNTREVQYFDSALTDAQLETLTSWTSLQEMITSQLYTNY